MPDPMERLISAQLAVFCENEGTSRDDLDTVAGLITSYESHRTTSDASHYAAGYLRACADMANITLLELLENL